MGQEGWRVTEGWQLPPQPFDLSDERCICVGAVGCGEDVTAAVLAAARGAGVVAWEGAGLAAHDREALMDDLRRIGPLEIVEPRSARLDQDQCQLLELLAEGESTADAAARLFLSRRTAERRLAAARRALGVRTTAEAVMAMLEQREDQAE